MAELNIPIFDRTLAEINKALEKKKAEEEYRLYLGMSIIGEECWRKLFYTFRQANTRNMPASGVKATEDGYMSEKVMAQRLRMIPGIELYTTKPDDPDEQISYTLLDGHFTGHVDGIIRGIIEAPKTWHIWENKAVNVEKFEKLKTIREKNGVKEALQLWDVVYYAQAQIYMKCAGLDRHFLTVTTPGARDDISIRTDLNRSYTANLEAKAQTIINDNWTLPDRLSEKREFFKCKWCEYQEICHDGKIPLTNCKTCRYCKPIAGGENQCLLTSKIINKALLKKGKSVCEYHIFNPALIPAELVEHQEDGCIYRIPERNITFANTNITGIPKSEPAIDYIFTSFTLKREIQYINNIGKDQPIVIPVKKA